MQYAMRTMFYHLLHVRQSTLLFQRAQHIPGSAIEANYENSINEPYSISSTIVKVD